VTLWARERRSACSIPLFCLNLAPHMIQFVLDDIDKHTVADKVIVMSRGLNSSTVCWIRLSFHTHSNSDKLDTRTFISTSYMHSNVPLTADNRWLVIQIINKPYPILANTQSQLHLFITFFNKYVGNVIQRPAQENSDCNLLQPSNKHLKVFYFY